MEIDDQDIETLTKCIETMSIKDKERFEIVTGHFILHKLHWDNDKFVNLSLLCKILNRKTAPAIKSDVLRLFLSSN